MGRGSPMGLCVTFFCVINLGLDQETSPEWLVKSDPVQSISTYLLTLSQMTNDSFKFKVFADNNFEFDENGRKFFKPLEKAVGKGEIARYEQFLLFPQFF